MRRRADRCGRARAGIRYDPARHIRATIEQGHHTRPRSVQLGDERPRETMGRSGAADRAPPSSSARAGRATAAARRPWGIHCPKLDAPPKCGAVGARSPTIAQDGHRQRTEPGAADAPRPARPGRQHRWHRRVSTVCRFTQAVAGRVSPDNQSNTGWHNTSPPPPVEMLLDREMTHRCCSIGLVVPGGDEIRFDGHTYQPPIGVTTYSKLLATLRLGSGSPGRPARWSGWPQRRPPRARTAQGVSNRSGPGPSIEGRAPPTGRSHRSRPARSSVVTQKNH